MTLLEQAVKAHGGFDRWNKFEILSAHLFVGGVLWGLKGHPGFLAEADVKVDLRNEFTSHSPINSPHQKSSFTPGRIAIETTDGKVVEELLNPRDSFRGHTAETPWTTLQALYFAGYAMWTYLNTPFLLARPGVESTELEPWTEKGETWRRLRVHFPKDIATHSDVQTFYFDESGLLKRHDYEVDISGGSPGAHYVYDLKAVSGIVIPTKRRVFGRALDGHSLPTPVVVSIDLSNIVLS